MGIQTAWMLWLGQVAAPAANANLFVIYLGEFFPHARDPLPRAIILTALVGLLTFINIRGVRAGAQVSNLFTAAKLVPLFAVIVLGLFVLQRHHWVIATAPVASPGTSQWLKAMLLLVFAYGGFETALAPMSEAKNPRRDAPFALFTALLALHRDLRANPVGGRRSPARRRAQPAPPGRRGAAGGRSYRRGAGCHRRADFFLRISQRENSRHAPRPLRPGRAGRLPQSVRRRASPLSHALCLDARLRGLIWGLALIGDFKWNVTLSAVARLLYYGVGCAALPMLRRKQPEGAAQCSSLPAGNFFAVLGVILCCGAR